MQRLHDEASRDALQRMRDESLARLRILRDEQRLALERYQVSSFSEMQGASPQEKAPSTTAEASTTAAAGTSQVAAAAAPMRATVPTPTIFSGIFSSTVEALGVDSRDPASVPSTATAVDVAGPTPGSHEYDNSVHVLQLLFDHLDSNGTIRRRRRRRTITTAAAAAAAAAAVAPSPLTAALDAATTAREWSGEPRGHGGDSAGGSARRGAVALAP